MPKEKKTIAELKAENRMLKRGHIVNGISRVLSDLIRYGVFGFLGYCVYLSIESLSGRTTAANIAVNFLSDVRVSESLAWILSGSGLAYGWTQNRLRKKTVERLQGRITTLERKLDSRRTSSSLTTRGETRPEDQ